VSASTSLPPDRRLPHPARLSTDAPRREEILRRHEEAMALGRAMYADPATGLMVMTAQALWDRGACCDSGCRHCPYLERPAP
jgi:hypothetical protein